MTRAELIAEGLAKTNPGAAQRYLDKAVLRKEIEDSVRKKKQRKEVT